MGAKGPRQTYVTAREVAMGLGEYAIRHEAHLPGAGILQPAWSGPRWPRRERVWYLRPQLLSYPTGGLPGLNARAP